MRNWTENMYPMCTSIHWSTSSIKPIFCWLRDMRTLLPHWKWLMMMSNDSNMTSRITTKTIARLPNLIRAGIKRWKTTWSNQNEKPLFCLPDSRSRTRSWCRMPSWIPRRGTSIMSEWDWMTHTCTILEDLCPTSCSISEMPKLNDWRHLWGSKRNIFLTLLGLNLTSNRDLLKNIVFPTE